MTFKQLQTCQIFKWRLPPPLQYSPVASAPENLQLAIAGARQGEKRMRPLVHDLRALQMLSHYSCYSYCYSENPRHHVLFWTSVSSHWTYFVVCPLRCLPTTGPGPMAAELPWPNLCKMKDLSLEEDPGPQGRGSNPREDDLR